MEMCFSGITTSVSFLSTLVASQSASPATRLSCNTCLVFNRFRIRRKGITWLVSVIVPQTTCHFSVIFAVFKQIVHWNYNVNGINFWNAVGKWCIVFKCNTFVSFCIILFCNNNNSFCNKIRITKITQVLVF